MKGSDVGGGLYHGKVTREVLGKVFGGAVLTALEVYGQRLGANVIGGGSGRATPRASGQEGGDGGDDAVDLLAGSEEVAGKLQVT